jgi:hypothetical protein
LRFRIRVRVCWPRSTKSDRRVPWREHLEISRVSFITASTYSEIANLQRSPGAYRLIFNLPLIQQIH